MNKYLSFFQFMKRFMFVNFVVDYRPNTRQVAESSIYIHSMNTSIAISDDIIGHTSMIQNQNYC